MVFLANPCDCGWSLDELDENTKECEKCHRRMERRSWGWIQVTPKDKIVYWNPEKKGLL